MLGCTHYPLIGDALQRLLPEVRHWVDSGEAIARRAGALLEDAGFPASELVNHTSSGHRCLFSAPATPAIDPFLAGLGFRRVADQA